MIKEDFVIQSEVRRMLIRSNIDYTKIDFGTVRGVVYLRGFFKLSRMPGEGDEGRVKDFLTKTLYSFEKKVRNISGVTDVVFQFVNWKKEIGQWIPTQWKRKEERREEKKEEKHEDKTDSDIQKDSEGA
ncbi:MAG: hypothetical protein A2V86_08965 [Deltaproteobacteria bacterium RBG_16_49_23]|nr:MAG: hypothetical protein A2V86_08965 [Deltaproteobacteria bacterium RBG_16_49_23]